MTRGTGASVARQGIRLAAAVLFLASGYITLSSRFETRAEAVRSFPAGEKRTLCRVFSACLRDKGVCHYHDYYRDHYSDYYVEKLTEGRHYVGHEGQLIRGWTKAESGPARPGGGVSR